MDTHLTEIASAAIPMIATEPYDVTKMLWSVFAIFVLVALNGFFVASEFAVVRVRDTQLIPLAENGSRAAKLGLLLTKHLDAYLSATQLGITITSILLGWIGEPAISKFFIKPIFDAFSLFPNQPWVMRTTSVIFGTGVITLLHVVLGELMPKSIAIQKPRGTTLFVAYPLYAFYRIMYPAIAVLNGTANAILRFIGFFPASEISSAHSEDELRRIVVLSQERGYISTEAQDLLENVFDLRETFIREIMLPRNQVVYFDITQSFEKNIIKAHKTGHSRYPLVNKDLDDTIGVIHIKDLFWKLTETGYGHNAPIVSESGRDTPITGGNIPAADSDFLRRIVRKLEFVPETLTLDGALKQFRTQRIHIAMVVDEFGIVTGMVTFENIIEAIVGDVRDEFDAAETNINGQIISPAHDIYIMNGETKIDDVNEELGTALEAEEVDTIAGLFMHEAGHLPKTGERVVIGNVELTAQEIDGLRLKKLKLRKLRTQKPDED